MTPRIVGSSLRFRWLVIFAAVALMVFGIGETRNAPEDAFPEFAPPRAEIQTTEDIAKRPVNADLLTMLLLAASCLGASLGWLLTQTQRQRVVIRFLVVRPSLASAGKAPPSLGVFRL